jgi:DNA-binding SARP family transcriptional activator
VRAAQPRPEAADADLREALVAGAARDHKRLDSERPDKPLVERLQRALKLGIEPGPGLPALVTGPLLAGVETCWARAARERQRQRFVLAVDKLSVLLEGHQTDASRRLFERAMDADPAAETIARRLIRLHVMHGRPSEAWRVLNLSAAMVELETGLVLAPETRRLAAELGLLPPSFTGMSPDGWSSEAAAVGRR